MAETANADSTLRPYQTGNPRADTLVDLTAAYVADEGRSTRPELTHFPAIALSLLPYVSLSNRASVAAKLAGFVRTPRRLLNALARDAIEVAEPVLRQASGLTDGDLVDIAASTTPAHGLAIARRRRLSVPVIDALIARNATDIDAILRECHANTLQPDQAATLRKRGHQQDATLNRPANVPKAANGLPDRTLAELFWKGDAEARKAVVTVFSRKQGRPSRPLASRIAALSPSTGIALLQLASAHRGGDLVAALARIADINRYHAARILTDKGGEPLAITLAAIGVEQDVAARLLAVIGPADPERQNRLIALGSKLPQQNAARLVLALVGQAVDEDTARTARYGPGVMRGERVTRAGAQRKSGQSLPARQVQRTG